MSISLGRIRAILLGEAKLLPPKGWKAPEMHPEFAAEFQKAEKAFPRHGMHDTSTASDRDRFIVGLGRMHREFIQPIDMAKGMWRGEYAGAQQAWEQEKAARAAGKGNPDFTPHPAVATRDWFGELEKEVPLHNVPGAAHTISQIRDYAKVMGHGIGQVSPPKSGAGLWRAKLREKAASRTTPLAQPFPRNVPTTYEFQDRSKEDHEMARKAAIHRERRTPPEALPADIKKFKDDRANLDLVWHHIGLLERAKKAPIPSPPTAPSKPAPATPALPKPPTGAASRPISATPTPVSAPAPPASKKTRRALRIVRGAAGQSVPDIDIAAIKHVIRPTPSLRRFGQTKDWPVPPDLRARDYYEKRRGVSSNAPPAPAATPPAAPSPSAPVSKVEPKVVAAPKAAITTPFPTPRPWPEPAPEKLSREAKIGLGVGAGALALTTGGLLYAGHRRKRREREAAMAHAAHYGYPMPAYEALERSVDTLIEGAAQLDGAACLAQLRAATRQHLALFF